MIHKSLQFLATEINKYLSVKLSGYDINEPRLVVGNIALASKNNDENELKNKVVLTLINVEEDKEIRNQRGRPDQGNKFESSQDRLNLYLLFSMNIDNYGECIDILSRILSFFQNQSVFTPTTHPALHNLIGKLVVEKYNLNFEQLSQLWSILGARYLPSIMYKVMIVAQDNNTNNELPVQERIQ